MMLLTKRVLCINFMTSPSTEQDRSTPASYYQRCVSVSKSCDVTVCQKKNYEPSALSKWWQVADSNFAILTLTTWLWEILVMLSLESWSGVVVDWRRRPPWWFAFWFFESEQAGKSWWDLAWTRVSRLQLQLPTPPTKNTVGKLL